MNDSNTDYDIPMDNVEQEDEELNVEQERENLEQEDEDLNEEQRGNRSLSSDTSDS